MYNKMIFIESEHVTHARHIKKKKQLIYRLNTQIKMVSLKYSFTFIWVERIKSCEQDLHT